MKKIKGIKAFNEDMTCNNFQFEEGKEYKTKEAKICKSGFHFCTNPLEVLDYYDLCTSKFHEVESLGETDKHTEDSKVCTTKINIGVSLDLKSFIKASFDFIWEGCKIKKSDRKGKQASSGGSSKQASSGHSSQQASSGDYSKQASSGHSSKQASSGGSSKQASSGDYSKQASSGGSSKQASSGDYSQQASSGHSSKQASSGGSSKQASSGYYSQQASSGDYSKQASSGYYSQHEMKGKHSVAVCSGKNSMIKGKKGCWITLSEWKYSSKEGCSIPVCVKSAKIDGKKIKEDAFYKLEDGKFKEVKN